MEASLYIRSDIDTDCNKLLTTVTAEHTNITVKYYDIGSDRMQKSANFRVFVNDSFNKDCLKDYHEQLQTLKTSLWNCNYDDLYRTQRMTLEEIDEQVENVKEACELCVNMAKREETCFESEVTPTALTFQILLHNITSGLSHYQEMYESCFDNVEAEVYRIADSCL
ncbi:hypothetical protein FQR65_LT10670 [Abscondita terminalis]|nr:hypothetical protein FQR65_LT10670 [Abscondita terminalis]